MTDLKAWKDRIDNELELQKYYQKDIVTMSFTRRELIELRIMFETLHEHLNAIKND